MEKEWVKILFDLKADKTELTGTADVLLNDRVMRDVVARRSFEDEPCVAFAWLPLASSCVVRC
jgi:hypothetical protein